MAKKDGKSKPVIRNIHKRSLFVGLTDAEVLERGTTMAEYQLDIEKIGSEEEELKVVAKALKVDRESRTNDLARIAKIVREKRERRMVECHDLFDFAEGNVQLIRLDTDEIVEERIMRDSDRQMELFPDEKASGDAPKDEGNADV